MSVPAAYLGIVLIWSTTPLAIQWSSLGTGFAFAVFARMAIGAVLVAVLLAIWRTRLPLHRAARHTYVASGLGMFGAMVLTYWGARYVNSGLISVLFGLSPLLTGLLAAFWLDGAPLTHRQLAGIALGVLGLATIFLQGGDVGDAHAMAGLGALLLAVLIYSVSLVWIKRIGDDSPPLATTAGTLAIALPLFALVWWFADGHVPAVVSFRAGAAIVYLGVFGSVLAYVLFYYVMKHLDIGRVTLIPLITPVLALMLGHALNSEEVALRVWFGTALIVGGLALHQWESVRGLAPVFVNRLGR